MSLRALRPALWCYRGLLRLLPADFRAAAGPDLEAAAKACLAREHARLGGVGLAWASFQLALDAIVCAVAVRTSPSAPHDSQPPRRGVVEAFMDNLLNDLKYALRGLRRQPGFALLTVLTLALGIGANTAIFSVVNGVLLRPLPYPKAEQLEYITTTFPSLGFNQFWMSLPEVLELQAHNQAFSSVGAFNASPVTLNTDRPSRVNGAYVVADFMKTLGVAPLAGRALSPEDSREGAPDVAVLSWELWRRDFASDPQIVGRTVRINDAATTIVGVMPKGYDIHDQKVEVWLPITVVPATLPNQRSSHYLYVVARRRDGTTHAQAQADLRQMTTHWQDFAAEGARHILTSDPTRLHDLRIDPLKDDMIGGVRTALVVLQGAVGFVLLIACANLANLLLARAEARQREFAVRTAMGAARTRLFSQFVTEGLVLSILGAIAGIGLAWLALKGLLTINADAIPRSAEVGLDGRVLLFTLTLAAATSVVFGLAPLLNLRGVGGRLMTSLRDGTRTTGGRLPQLIRGSLVVAEITLAVVLVTGAGLFVRSLSNLLTVDAGFNRDPLMTFGVVLPAQRYTPVQRAEFYARLNDRLAALPGVKSVASMSGLPPNRAVNANDTDFEHIPNIAGRDPKFPPENVDYYQRVTANYTQTMGIPVVKGRGFEASDATGPLVALINESAEKRFFTGLGVDPIGARVRPGFGDTLPWLTIVGVVKDVKQGGVDQPVGTELYFLVDQGARVGSVPNAMNVVLRTTQPMATIAPSIERVTHDIDPSLPIVKMRTMDDVFGDSVSRPRFITLLLEIFAGLAIALAAIGTYGVLSYVVTQQAQEIGIRLALGASRGTILSIVLRKGLLLAAIGLGLGVAGALGMSRLLRTLLFEVSPTDPLTLVLVALTMTVVAVAACLVPAYRATKVDPITTLRNA